MLDLKMLTDQPEQLRQRLSVRGEVPGLDRLMALALRRLELIGEVEGLRHEQKQAGTEMKTLVKKDPAAAAALREKLKGASARQKELDSELKTAEEELQ